VNFTEFLSHNIHVMRDSFTTVCGLQKEIYVMSYNSASFESLL